MSRFQVGLSAALFGADGSPCFDPDILDHFLICNMFPSKESSETPHILRIYVWLKFVKIFFTNTSGNIPLLGVKNKIS